MRLTFACLYIVLSAFMVYSFANLEYKCHHDTYMEKISHQIEAEKFEAEELKMKVKKGEMGHKFSVLPVSGDYIRIYLDASRLENGVDSGYTCYTAGEVVVVDGSSVTCTSEMVLTAEKKDYLIELVNSSIEFFQKTLLVVPEDPGIAITSSNCGDLTDVATQTYTGYDYILSVAGRPSTGNVLAYATSCGFAARFRPKSGFANFGPSNLNPSQKNFQYFTSTHEISHALGFSYSRIGFFVGDDGLPISPSYIQTVDAPGASDGQPQIKILTSPLVKSFVQTHFQCTSLAGAALEDGGGSGTASSHWEKRIFHDEFMVGSVIYSPAITGLTLSFFDDSGWYSVNYSQADVAIWGYKEGCSFAEETCDTWSSTYFCTDYAKTYQCSNNRRGRGVCDISASLSSLPAYHQYFSESHIGGSDYLADYCPRIQAMEYCGDGSIYTTEMNDYGESLGFDSLCYISSLVRVDQPLSRYDQPRCYTSKCLSENEIRFKIDGIWYPCKSGSNAQVDGFRNSLICPDPGDFCHGVENIDNSSIPTFSSIDPSGGTAKGGTRVTIRGGNMDMNCTILIGGVNVSSVEWVDSTEVIAVTGDATSNVKTTSNVNVLILNPDSEYPAVGYGVFEMEWTIFDILRNLPYIGVYLGYAMDYAIAYPIVAIILGLLIIGCGGCVCVVFQAWIIKRNHYPKLRKKKKKEKVHPRSVQIEDPESHMYFNQVSKITYSGGPAAPPGKMVF